MSLSSDVAREHTGRLAARKGPAKLQSGLARRGRITAIIILVAFKGIGRSRRALLWNRQASIILDLVLSACVFAACSGKASAQSHDASSSTGFADYAMNLGEDPLHKLREMTPPRYSAKALPEMIGEPTRHLQAWSHYPH